VKSWKNWRTIRPPIYKRTPKDLLRNLPTYEGIEWANSKTFSKDLYRELKAKTVDVLQSTNAVCYSLTIP
jgi:hypothetical protein